jgi:hypothetical protein
MAPKYHPTPISGGDRKALTKELTKARAMTRILVERANEKRAAGEALIREADGVGAFTQPGSKAEVDRARNRVR